MIKISPQIKQINTDYFLTYLLKRVFNYKISVFLCLWVQKNSFDRGLFSCKAGI